MSETNPAAAGTIPPAGDTNDEFRETIVIAIGPNVSGLTDQAIAAQTPDPANVDDTGEFDEPHTTES